MGLLRFPKMHIVNDARSLRALLRDDSGVTAIEYGLIAALIAVAAVTAFSTVGTDLSNTFNTIASNL